MIAECDDYVNSIQVPQLIKTSILQGGEPEMNGIRPVMYTGGFCVVFPYKMENQKYAIRCWHAYLEGAQERAKEISNYLNEVNLPYFVKFQYVDEGMATPKGVMPLVVMDWVDAKPLKKYIQDIIGNTSALERLASNFLKMVQDLHTHEISHGDLQHGNILVKDNGEIVLVDYDSMYVPNLKGYSNQINGLEGYQHPARWTTKEITPKADYFSELIIYTSIVALSKFPNLWEELKMQDTETMIFSKEDIESKGYSSIFNELTKDSYLKQLVSIIRQELACSSIDELLPLEDVEPNNKHKAFLDNLSKEWSDNGYTPQQNVKIDTRKTIEEQRKEWAITGNESQYNTINYNALEIDETKNEWN